ncbi:hypothetical protein BSKO_09563 [Bryopsis sp. KO-2023]|nr:hypothetical protein BSKO_09563 [Bryopsis sp. KO-2023]
MKMEGDGASPKSPCGGGGGGSDDDNTKLAVVEPKPNQPRHNNDEALKEVEKRLSKDLLERYTLQDIVLTIRGQVQCIRAVEDKTGDTVLLKVSLTPTGAQILNREGEMMDEVDITNTLELIEDPGNHLVMEWPERGNLEDYLEKGPLDIEEVREIAGDIFRALNDLHQNGYVHEDVRPVHIWLTDDGAKLTGYGLRRATDSTSARHWAPELRFDDGTLPVHSVDMWAMGVLMLEMLTGEHVFPEEDDDRHKMHKRLRDPFKLAAFVSNQLEEFEDEDEEDMAALERLLARLLDNTPSKHCVYFPSAVSKKSTERKQEAEG